MSSIRRTKTVLKQLKKKHIHLHTALRTNTKKIATFAEAPEFLRVPFIHTGYRVGYDLYECFSSLIQIHNETVNIWSHLIGTFILVGLLFHVVDRFSKYGFVHTFVPCIYLFCAAYGLFASCVFHWFNCINSTYHVHLRTLDFGGIAMNILGASWPIAYYTFYCHSTSLYIYLAILSITTPLLLALPFIQFFHNHTYMRTFLYAINGGIPAYGYIHFVIMEGFSSEFLPVLFGPVGVAYIFFVTGMFLYLTRIPERFWPGAFDLLGTSHQIWHFLVVIGQWVLYHGITEAAGFRYNSECSA